MTPLARKVTCTIRKGRTTASYCDLVQLSAGEHAGQFALVNPVVPLTRADHIQRLLSDDEALTMLESWLHMERPAPTGSYSCVTREGRQLLRRMMQTGRESHGS